VFYTIVCFQVRVSASGTSLGQRSLIKCDVCVWYCTLNIEVAFGQKESCAFVHLKVHKGELGVNEFTLVFM
jgi:hypothetical protein